MRDLSIRQSALFASISIGVLGACTEIVTGPGSSLSDGGGADGMRMMADGGTALDGSGDQGTPATGHHAWVKRLGDESEEIVTGLAVDRAGNAYVVGSFSEITTMGGSPLTSAGGYDLFIAKYAPDGSHLWSQRFGGTGQDSARSIAVDASGDVILVAGFEETVNFGGDAFTSAGYTDIALVKYSSSGAHLWSRQLGGDQLDDGVGVAVDSSGNIVLTGSFHGDARFGSTTLKSAGNADIFVSKWSGSGVHLWSKNFGGTDFDRGYSVACDSAGNILLGGEFYLTADFGGPSLSSNGVGDVFIAKLAPDGSHLWSRKAGEIYSDSATSIAVDSEGNAFLTGTYGGTIDFGNGTLNGGGGGTDIFLVKYSPTGTPLWSKSFASISSDNAFSVATDASGSVLLGGNFYGSVNFGGGVLTSSSFQDAFLAKYSSTGAHLFSSQFGGGGSETFYSNSVRAIATDANGDVLAAGNFISSASFYGTTLTPAGLEDIFLLRRAP